MVHEVTFLPIAQAYISKPSPFPYIKDHCQCLHRFIDLKGRKIYRKYI